MQLVQDLGLREIEDILYCELKNWADWARRKDYLPETYRCPLGQLYIREDDQGTEPVERRIPIDEAEAQQMEAIINALPVKQRRAFLLHHLQRAKVGEQIVIVRGRQRQAQVLGICLRQYHYLLLRGHQTVYAKWKAQEAERGAA